MKSNFDAINFEDKMEEFKDKWEYGNYSLLNPKCLYTFILLFIFNRVDLLNLSKKEVD